MLTIGSLEFSCSFIRRIVHIIHRGREIKGGKQRQCSVLRCLLSLLLFQWQTQHQSLSLIFYSQTQHQYTAIISLTDTAPIISIDVDIVTVIISLTNTSPIISIDVNAIAAIILLTDIAPTIIVVCLHWVCSVIHASAAVILLAYIAPIISADALVKV